MNKGPLFLTSSVHLNKMYPVINDVSETDSSHKFDVKIKKDLQFDLYLYLDFNMYDFMELSLLTENIWYHPPSTQIKMLFEKSVP